MRTKKPVKKKVAKWTPPKFERLHERTTTPAQRLEQQRASFKKHADASRLYLHDVDEKLIDRYLSEKRTIVPFQPLQPISIAMSEHNTRQKAIKPWSLITALLVRGSLRQLGAHLKSLTPETTFLTFDKSSLESFAAKFEIRTVARLKEQYAHALAESRTERLNPWATATWRSLIKNSKEFLAWLEEKGLRPPGSSPLANVAIPDKPPYNRSRFIIRSHYQDVLDLPEMQYRQQAIVGLLSNGLRSIEVRRLRIQDVSEDCSEVTVVGKASKIRIAYLNTYAQNALRSYLLWRHRIVRDQFPDKTETFLFFRSRTGLGALTMSGLHRSVARLAIRAGHRRTVHPHGFRHFYVTKCVEAGMPDRVIAAQIGHDGSRLIALYTHMDRDYLKAQVKHYIE